MTRSRRRKITRERSHEGSLALRRGTPIAAALLTVMPGAYAADKSALAQEGLEEVIVTAQKRVENLQDVPISVQVFEIGRASCRERV